MICLIENRKGEALVRNFFSVVTVLLCAGMLVAAEHGAEPPEGKVTLIVEVINGTEGGQNVSGDEVTLNVYRHNEFVTSVKAIADANGKAVFEDISGGGHLVATVHAMHQDMRFGGDVISLTTDAGSLSANIMVFDVLLDNSVLSSQTHHVIIKPQGEDIVFTEFVQVTNPTSYAVSSAEKDSENKPVVLRFSLPKGYSDFNSSSYFVTNALVFSEDSFYDTMAMPPGSHQMMFSYTLSAPGKLFDVTKKLSLATKSFILFSYLDDEALEGLGEPDGELVSEDGLPARYYNRSNLPAGTEISFKVSGLVTSPASRLTWFVLPIIFGVIIIIALMRTRGSRAQEA
jgi:hypothetical protein